MLYLIKNMRVSELADFRLKVRKDLSVKTMTAEEFEVEKDHVTSKVYIELIHHK